MEGRFDLDNCFFEVTPKPYDNYAEFDNKGDDELDILDVVPAVTVIAGSVTYTRNRWLMDVIEYLALNIAPAATVSSDFFTTATNYVTTTTNRLTGLVIAQKSDIKRPTSSNPANNAMLSWNELMNILRMFNVYWTFDGSEIRIEHVSYWSKTDGLDLRNQKMAERSNKYSYAKNDMPKYEKFAFMEAKNDDFVGVPIYYDSSCVGTKNNNSIDYAVEVTTDIEYIQASIAEGLEVIDDKGFVIMATYVSGTDNVVYFNTGQLSGLSYLNNDLSWANLHFNFFRHDRILEEGYMNNILTAFATIKPNKVHNIKAIVCYEDNYSPNDLITTELGETWLDGEKGEVFNAQIKPTGEVEFELRYGVTTDISGTSPAYRKVLWFRDDGDGLPYIEIFLSENAPFDLYFWVYINATNCQQIMIPAGANYHTELFDLAGLHAPFTYEYNFGDPSTTEWSFVYNDHETYAECDPLDCGGTPPTPPANPTVTVMVHGSQSWSVSTSDGSIAEGMTSLYYEFTPVDAALKYGTAEIYLNGVFDKKDYFSMKNGMTTYETATVTSANYGDNYIVYLYEGII